MNLKCYYRFHNRIPLVPIQSQLNPIQTLLTDFLLSISMFSRLRLGIPSFLFTYVSLYTPTNLCIHLSPPPNLSHAPTYHSSLFD